MKPVLAIGMMSGTSIDGAVDAAALLTDGDSFVERRHISAYRYEDATGPRPIHHLTKAAEIACRQARGNWAQAAAVYPSAVEEYIRQTFRLSDSDSIKEKAKALRAAFFGDDRAVVTLADIVEKSTEVHARAAEKILHELGDAAANVAFVGYHGQTLYHAPYDHVTVQAGNAQALADRLGIPVVFDFRRNDIEHGGQGAPLAPVYHRALLRKAGLAAAVILNLGGTANITVVSAATDEITGFDTGPANGLIDRYVKEKAGIALDEDSRLALRGRVDDGALQSLLDHAIILADGRNYLRLPPPKSLDIRDYRFDFPAFLALPAEDGCATLNAFAAACIAEATDWLKTDMPENWILCGGGAQSPHLCAEIKTRVSRKTGKNITLLPAESAGWSAQGMEAELFAYLAVRSSRQLPLTFPGTTGVASPLTGGQIFYPKA